MSVREVPGYGGEGRRCYVIGDGDGPVSRLVNEMEAARLEPTEGALDGPESTYAELVALVAQLAHALDDVLRIAECGGTTQAR
ncbi:hypothetical protein AMK26_27435 [Streptomyces sp. CB03234]|uniref:hypothetical protein n=1 Tax=Streptomyces sp. (strain CB03234) TaxID=1703937 RepID=UPI00093B1257|nr:hypothetical protein [Streptomyces sp. CB03234]OKJ99733.1 hypothetical protein AMK26_27435 [Streptomyces sp. CB03234]